MLYSVVFYSVLSAAWAAAAAAMVVVAVGQQVVEVAVDPVLVAMAIC